MVLAKSECGVVCKNNDGSGYSDVALSMGRIVRAESENHHFWQPIGKNITFKRSSVAYFKFRQLELYDYFIILSEKYPFNSGYNP